MSKPTAKKIAALEQQLAERTADVQRIQAEFINFKNRTHQDQQRITATVKADVIKDILPVVDDIERALNHLPADLKKNTWAQGVQKIHDRLLAQLKKLDVTKLESLNQPFNPEFHEAVQVEGEGEHQVVSEVLQEGYRYQDQVIRHAVVKVSNR